jgi:hypothetical protein
MLIREINGFYKVECPSCKIRFLIPISDYKHMDRCSKCLEVTPMETSGRLEIPEPHKIRVEEIVETDFTNVDNDISRAETDIIRKSGKSKKKNNK